MEKLQYIDLYKMSKKAEDGVVRLLVAPCHKNPLEDVRSCQKLLDSLMHVRCQRIYYQHIGKI
jgi:hypothetical protein